MTIDLRKTKIRVNSEQESELFQNFAYDTQGVKWTSQTLGEFETKYTDAKFLLISKDLIFTYTNNEFTFENNSYREITLEQFGLKKDARVDSKKESEILKFLNYNSFELKRMMDNEKPLFDAVNSVIGVLLEKYEPETKITEPEKVAEQEVEEKWRFKTLDEIKQEGLGFFGTSEKIISEFAGKELKDLNIATIPQAIETIKNKGNIDVGKLGYRYSYMYFTNKPIESASKQETQEQLYTQAIETIPAKKEWVPQDLVGKTLLFGQSGRKYTVEKFTRNNPKNKEYKLRNITSPEGSELTYKISMSLVKKWLDGQAASGVRIIEEKPTGTDYSKWTQSQLLAKRKEISDALIAFEEEDPEYKELKAQLDIIDAFID